MSTVPLWAQWLAAAMLVVSGVFTVIGTLGLIRLPTFYCRIHAPTMGNTLGVFLLLVTWALLYSFIEHRVLFHQLVITVLLIITSPSTAILTMRAAIRRDEYKARELADKIQSAIGRSDHPVDIS